MEGCGGGTLALRLSRASQAVLRFADHPQMARSLPPPFLQDQPVQALGASQLAEGLDGRKRQPARRLARSLGRNGRAMACGTQGRARRIGPEAQQSASILM